MSVERVGEQAHAVTMTALVGMRAEQAQVVVRLARLGCLDALMERRDPVEPGAEEVPLRRAFRNPLTAVSFIVHSTFNNR